ncbi:MAG: peptidylprolyl isomerase [Ilumatobacteraceae bacterium]
MIRRPHLAVLATLAAAFAVSSCSTFTDNSNAARVGDAALPRDDVATLVREADATEANAGPFLQAQVARGLITSWVRVVVLETENGVPADQAASIENLDSRLSTALNALVSGNFDEAEAVYQQGPSVSGVVCLGAIPLASAEQGTEVLSALEGGLSFAEAAAQYSTDPGLADNGGIVTDDQGSECVAVQQLSPDLATQLDGVSVGTPIAVTLQDLDAVIVVRPFDSLSDDSKRDVALVTIGADVIPTALTNADVTIDSRYGYWDPETAQVVAFNT